MTTAKPIARTFDPVAIVAPLASILVGLLALVAFILSYSALQHLAAEAGLNGWLSYLWPLLLDGAMIVFSLSILRANFRQERSRYAWGLTICFAILATAGNVLEVTRLGISPVIVSAAVKALAPIALVLSFELLMSMIKAEVSRNTVSHSLAELNRQREVVAAELRREQADFERQCEQLSAQVSRLQADHDKSHDTLKTLKLELSELRKEKRQLKRPTPVKRKPTEQSADERANNLALANAARQPSQDDFDRAAAQRAEGLTWHAVAEALGISESTAKRWAAQAPTAVTVNGVSDAL